MDRLFQENTWAGNGDPFIVGSGETIGMSDAATSGMNVESLGTKAIEHPSFSHLREVLTGAPPLTNILPSCVSSWFCSQRRIDLMQREMTLANSRRNTSGNVFMELYRGAVRIMCVCTCVLLVGVGFLETGRRFESYCRRQVERRLCSIKSV